MKFQNQVLILAAAALAAGMTACSYETPWDAPQGQGGIKLHVSADSKVTDAVPTRSTDENAPAAQDFSVRLEKSDGTFTKEWPLLEDFNAVKGFNIGSYTLTAFYGKPEEQGFECPYYEGVTELDVLESRLTETSVTATLANSKVEIIYTEAFQKYFSNWSAAVKSEGHASVEIPQGETRPAYFCPGNTDLSVTIVRSGKATTIQPASFTAMPRHYYHITLDVNGGQVGDAQLQITFDDTVEQEDVTIDLTDELFTSEAPSVKSTGFSSGDAIEFLSQETPENPYKFTVIGRGGLQEVTFTVASSDYTPTFGKELNLIAATPAQQAQLAQEGVKVIGLFKNPENMASVDVTDFISGLPAGEYTIEVQAKDKFTRVSEPVSLRVTSVPMTLSATPGLCVYGSTNAQVMVSYNGTRTEDITFKAMNKAGVFADAPVAKVEEVTRSRSIETKDYLFSITLPDTEHNPMPVQVFLKGNKVAEFNLEMKQPEYSIEADAYAGKMAIRVNAEKAEERDLIVNGLNVFAAPNVEGLKFTRDAANGLVWLHGLTPETAYKVTVSLTNKADDPKAKSVTATTEAAANVPNGDFSQTHETINMTKVTVGGPFLVGAITYHVFSSIVAQEPDGWASINAKTAYKNASNRNTWYIVPSTMAQDGAVKLRSVAYDLNGDDIKRTGSFLSTTYYNPTSANPKSRAAGELFLGSYSFDGNESREDGIEFSSRPSTLTFDYSYTPYGNENGEAHIAIYDITGAKIAEKDLTISSGSNQKASLKLDYPFGKKAAKMTIGFKSTKGNEIGVKIPSGSELNEGGGLGIDYTVGANKYKTLATGSELVIDNVSLGYDGVGGASMAPRKVRKVRKAVRK